MNVTPLRLAPIIPIATRIHGDFLLARKKVLLSAPRLVHLEMTIKNKKYSAMTTSRLDGLSAFIRAKISLFGASQDANPWVDCERHLRKWRSYDQHIALSVVFMIVTYVREDVPFYFDEDEIPYHMLDVLFDTYRYGRSDCVSAQACRDELQRCGVRF